MLTTSRINDERNDDDDDKVIADDIVDDDDKVIAEDNVDDNVDADEKYVNDDEFIFLRVFDRVFEFLRFLSF